MRRALASFLGILCLLLASCSGGGNGSGDAPDLDPDRVIIEGVVLDSTGEPISGVPVSVPGTGSEDVSFSDGSFAVEASRRDPRIRVGGERDTTFVVRLEVDDAEAARRSGIEVLKADDAQVFSRAATLPLEVGGAFFLAEADDGVARTLPSGPVTTDFVIDDPSLEGFFLRVLAGTTVAYPSGVREEVFLVGVAHDRLPLPFPNGRLSRFAIFVGPFDVTFSLDAELILPNVDGLAPGVVLDLVTLDEARGVWVIAGEAEIDPSGRFISGARIRRGGWFAALPRVVWPRTTIRGRVLGSGNEPLADFRVGTTGSLVTLSGPNGFFEITGVPAFPGEPVAVNVLAASRFRRSFLLSPGVVPVLGPEGDAPEPPEDTIGSLAPEPVTVFNDLRVPSILRSGFPPAVSFDPGRDATGIDEVVRIRVRFDRLMDLATLDVKVVRGISREQRGVDGELFVRFVGGGTELEFVPLEPLRNGVFYTIFIPKNARDLDGNAVDLSDVASRFTVRDTARVLGPRELRVHSVAPSSGAVGDDVDIIGENLNPEEVTFGDVDAFVSEFDDRERDLLRVRVPLDVTGEVPIGVRDLDGNVQGLFPFRAFPILDALESGIVEPEGDGSLVLTGIGAHLGSSPRIVWNGVEAGSFELLGDSECPGFELFLDQRNCFRVTLPAGPIAGLFFFEVDGFRTRGVFVMRRVPLDEDGPTVVAASVEDGATAGADVDVTLEFSELLDGRSAVEVAAGGAPVAGLDQVLRHRSGNASEIVLRPPEDGWPAGEVTVTAGDDVLDLAGRALDQDPATPALDPFVLRFTVDPPP